MPTLLLSPTDLAELHALLLILRYIIQVSLHFSSYSQYRASIHKLWRKLGTKFPH